MALPSRPHTFALENCRDLLNKLKREIERFSAAGNNIETRKDFAFNRDRMVPVRLGFCGHVLGTSRQIRDS